VDTPKASPALILVVDDDVRTARLLVKMLEEDGFKVELATDGALAIGRLARSPIPDILVTDVRMPHADGMTVAQFARSRRPNLPVFVVTGYPHLATKLNQCLEPRPVVHTKPLDYAALSDELRCSVGAGAPPPVSERSPPPPKASK
jgi:two-component system response regulator MprA